MNTFSPSPKVQVDNTNHISQRVVEATKTIVNNRSSAVKQCRLQESANMATQVKQLKVAQFFGNNQVIQRETRYMLKNGSIVKVEGPGKIEPRKRRTKEQYEDQVLRSTREADKPEQDAILAERKAVLDRQEAERVEQERVERIRVREAALSGIPLVLARSDNNFERTTNRSGQGKAHLTSHGLEPAGATVTTHREQLHQDSANKGTSNLVSFTGPNPVRGGTVYASTTAPVLEVKTKKLMRAKLKGKAEVAHIEVYTSSQVKSDPEVQQDQAATNFAKKDDEHQIRISLPVGGGAAAIPSRFLRGGLYRGAPLVDQHDSDSDEDN